MPVLTNVRYERFAQNLAKGLPQHEAYIKAGFVMKPAANRSDCSKMAHKPEIMGRVKELMERQAKRLDVSVDTLIAELDIMFKLALATKQPSAGVGATMGKAKLLGLVVDRAEVEASTVRRPMRTPGSDKKMSMDEWQKKFAPPPDKLQ